MRFLVIILAALAVSACNSHDDVTNGTSSLNNTLGPNVTSSESPKTDQDTQSSVSKYTIEISGPTTASIDMRIDLNNAHTADGTPSNSGDHQVDSVPPTYLAGNTPRVYTYYGYDILAAPRYVSGTGTVTVVFKKNDIAIQSQTITAPITSIYFHSDW